VQIPFLQVLAPEFLFVPIALGVIRFEVLQTIGQAIGRVIQQSREEILLVTTTDLNHYENEAVTRIKAEKAIEKLMAMDAHGLYDVCRDENVSMCGLGPSVAMITALHEMGGARAELVQHATSAQISGDTEHVVGYAGMLFQ